MNSIKLLDLCCGAGGAAMGYYLAAQLLGKEIVITGIDIKPQSNYPFNFIQADALSYLTEHWESFTHIHASPPCQLYTNATAKHRSVGKIYSDLQDYITPFLETIPQPSVIENVLQSPIRADLTLRGDMFGLKVIRRRKFQLNNWFMMQPLKPQLRGQVLTGDFVSVFGKEHSAPNGARLKGFEEQTILESWKYAMKMPWTTKVKELSEAIPPAYTNYIGLHLFTL